MKVINYDKLKKQEKLLYLAGVWDGEGSFAIVRNGKAMQHSRCGKSFRIMIAMTDLDVIQRFRDFFDYGNITIKRPTKLTVKGELYKVQYRWSVRGKPGFDFVKQMYPFFSERRKKKLRECYIEMIRRKRK